MDELAFLQAIFSNQLLRELFFIVMLFLAFLEYKDKEIRSNDFIVKPHVVSGMSRSLLISRYFFNMTVTLACRDILDVCIKDAGDS